MLWPAQIRLQGRTVERRVYRAPLGTSQLGRLAADVIGRIGAARTLRFAGRQLRKRNLFGGPDARRLLETSLGAGQMIRTAWG